jgi:hypothetical protein
MESKSQDAKSFLLRTLNTIFQLSHFSGIYFSIPQTSVFGFTELTTV